MRLAFLPILVRLLPLALVGCRTLLGFEDLATGDANTDTISFATPTTLVDEASGTVRIAVVSSSDLATASYRVSGGTATPSGIAAGDFSIFEGPLVFTGGGAEIEVTITPDALEEPDETIELELIGPTGRAISSETHTITISASLLARVAFSTPISSAAEDGAPVAIEITLDAPQSIPVSVDLQIGGTSTGADHGLVPATVVFAPNEVTKLLSLAIVSDLLDEDDETIDVALVNPVSSIIGGTPTTSHTIVDDDLPPTVQFNTLSSSLAEDVGTQNVSVELSAPSGKPITVVFALDGATTAGNPTDFTIPTTSPLTFPPGSSTQVIQIDLADDAIGELDDLVRLVLSSPTKATLGARTQHDVTIGDDDCLGASPFRVCPSAAPAGTLNLSGNFNTDTDGDCAAQQPVGWLLQNQPSSCFVIAQNINIPAVLDVTGSRPLVLVAGNAIVVSAQLDAAAHTTTNGPAGPSGLCAPFPTAPQGGVGAGAGAGGSFLSKGGNGGKGNNGARLGGTSPAADAADPVVLRGGCDGQAGAAAGTGGSSGRAGGAVYLVAGVSISITGSVDVSGAQGFGGDISSGGGGGAGSGGMILLDAPAISVAGTLMSNGGGGGEGASLVIAGENGDEPLTASPTTPAPGGNTASAGGRGGNGFAGATAAQAGNGGSLNEGGGGGGGGGGFIRSTGAITGTVSAGKIVVP